MKIGEWCRKCVWKERRLKKGEINIYERSKVEEGLAKLSNGVAVLKVGGERVG